MKIRTQYIMTLLFLLISLAAMSQPGTSGLDQNVDNENGVPIDGGLSVLLAAGAGYGAKKIRDARKKAK